jgi:hypothetical protein
MRFSPENHWKRIARGATYGSLLISSMLSGCHQAAENVIRSYPGKPEVELYPRIRCVDGEPKVSVAYKADRSIETLVIRVSDVESRLGAIHQVSSQNDGFSGQVEFTGVNSNINGRKTEIPFINGQTVGISASRVSEASQGPGRIVVYESMTPLWSVKMDCQQ